MPLAMTRKQVRDFDEQGYVVLEEFLRPGRTRPAASGHRRSRGTGSGGEGARARRALRRAQCPGTSRGLSRSHRSPSHAAPGGGRDRLEHPDPHHAPGRPAALSGGPEGARHGRRQGRRPRGGISERRLASGPWRATTCSWRLPSMDASRSWRSRSSTCSTT